MRAVFFSVLMLVGCAQSTTPPSESNEHRALTEAIAIIAQGCDRPATDDVVCRGLCEYNGHGTWHTIEKGTGHCEPIAGFQMRGHCRPVPLSATGHLRNVQIIDGNFVGEAVTENAGPAEEIILPNGYGMTFP